MRNLPVENIWNFLFRGGDCGAPRVVSGRHGGLGRDTHPSSSPATPATVGHVVTVAVVAVGVVTASASTATTTTSIPITAVHSRAAVSATRGEATHERRVGAWSPLSAGGAEKHRLRNVGQRWSAKWKVLSRIMTQAHQNQMEGKYKIKIKHFDSFVELRFSL